MAIDEGDIDRIADKVQIKIMLAFEDHRKNDHEPINAKIGAIKGKLATHKTVSAVSGVVGGALGSLGAWLAGRHS